jgi:hypothetical protein
MTKSAKMGAFVLWIAAAGATASVAVAPIAAADSATLPVPGTGPASEAIQDLQADGYNVMISRLEGHLNVPLSEYASRALVDRRFSRESVSQPSGLAGDVDVAVALVLLKIPLHHTAQRTLACDGVGGPLGVDEGVLAAVDHRQWRRQGSLRQRPFHEDAP